MTSLPVVRALSSMNAGPGQSVRGQPTLAVDCIVENADALGVDLPGLGFRSGQPVFDANGDVRLTPGQAQIASGSHEFDANAMRVDERRDRRRENMLDEEGGVVLLSAAASISALADEPSSADDISAAVGDHTYQGSMNVADSGFAEYDAPDCSIRADGHSGRWRTEDSVMCFQYGDNPETCFEVEFNGPSMEIYKDGALDGNGMLIEGNPNNF